MTEGVCSVAICDRPVQTRGYCSSHYRYWKRTGKIPTYQIRQKQASTCIVPGCERLAKGCAYCHTHYERVRLTGEPGSAEIRGADAERKFRERLEGLGATLLEPEWLGSRTPHEVRCINGHICHPMPGSVVNGGQGICVPCGYAENEYRKKKKSETRERFLERLAEKGATLLDEEWHGVARGYLVRCWCGHEGVVWPSRVSAGGGCCLACAGLDPKIVQRTFVERVAELGGEVLELDWFGVGRKYRARCANGHECFPIPTSVQQGQGICRTCSHGIPTIFYVVINTSLQRLKFGVTSGSPRRRLTRHRRHGYTTVVRLIEDADNALPLENHVKTTLRDAGMRPVQGLEYFDISGLGMVVDLVDNYPVNDAAIAA